MSTLEHLIQKAASNLIEQRMACIEQFLIAHNANPETQDLACYKEADTYVLVPKGAELPLVEAMKYPHITFTLKTTPAPDVSGS